MEKPSDYKLLAINLARAANRAVQEDIKLSIRIKVGVESMSRHFSFIFTRMKRKDLENFKNGFSVLSV